MTTEMYILIVGSIALSLVIGWLMGIKNTLDLLKRKLSREQYALVVKWWKGRDQR